MTTALPAPPSITLIAAVARNGTIGADGGLPWHLPADLKRFKALTMGHPMIMGRRTYDSIGRALPGRRTIVVTRDADWSAPGVTVAHSVDEAVDLALDGSDGRAADVGPVLVVGGGDIYRQTIGRANRLELTHVDAEVVGDTRFPDIDAALWRVSGREDADGYAFVSYERREPIRDLGVLLTTMAPVLHDGEYRFCTVRSGADVPAGLHPVATVAEAEGLTLVLPATEADANAMTGFACRWITLMVVSSMDAVGLTAAVSTALTREGISCNVIAGFHHDHLFVPVDTAARAMSALATLARAAGGTASDKEPQPTGAPGLVEP
jgi:dihydrofolate reductase